jgi:neutral ceramidase
VPERIKAGTLKGPVDHDVPVLVATDKAGKVKGVVFGYACHATTLSYLKWSGDYPGYAMLAVEKANPGAVAVFWAGCGADQNPLPRRTQELAEKYGKQLADSVAAAMKQQLFAVKPTSAAAYKEIELPLHELPTREQLAKESQATDKYVAARAKLLLDKLKTAKELPASYPYPVQTWQLGDQTWLHLGGEVVVDFSLRFKKDHGAVWTTAYANDVMAYIPSARVLKEGGYEGGGAMVYYGLPSVWGKDVEDRIAAEVARQVKAVDGK